MKLHKYYSIDECNNEELLLERLEFLQEDDKIEFELLDKWTLKIKDIDLTTNEEKKLVELFEELGLYETTVEDEDEDESYEEYDDFEDDYKPKKGRKSYDDDFDDF
jgi:hypothetical protein